MPSLGTSERTQRHGGVGGSVGKSIVGGKPDYGNKNSWMSHAQGQVVGLQHQCEFYRNERDMIGALLKRFTSPLLAVGAESGDNGADASSSERRA